MHASKTYTLFFFVKKTKKCQSQLLVQAKPQKRLDFLDNNGKHHNLSKKKNTKKKHKKPSKYKHRSGGIFFVTLLKTKTPPSFKKPFVVPLSSSEKKKRKNWEGGKCRRKLPAHTHILYIYRSPTIPWGQEKKNGTEPAIYVLARTILPIN